MSGYQAQFKVIKAQYDALEIFDISGSIATLDSAISTFSTDQSADNRAEVNARFSPISQYYSQLTTLNKTLRTFLETASTDIVNTAPGEERYENRIHPEKSSRSHEVMLGVFSDLKVQTMPYLLAAAVCMASISIFMIFQLGGLTGQINLPPALVSWWVTPSVGPPFYKNPMVLGGFMILLSMLCIVFAVLYFKNNKS